jgi:predicted phage terminase large subunit-like protein
MIAEAPIQEIAPQAGPQEQFLSTSADIAIYGGAAFGGKTFAICMEPLRHLNRPGFRGVIFRRTYPEIMNPGGLWETAASIYPMLGGIARESTCEWTFPEHDVVIKFAHMQHEKDKHSWQGSAIPFVGFDELTHFSRSMFLYMLSRNRLQRDIRMKPYVRATCNPDSASWVSDFIAWWIDQETGFPIPERAGVVRWMVRQGDNVVWGDTPDELAHTGMMPKSVTFIPAKITDNVKGMQQDPSYLSNLQALSLYEREQLLHGNWKIRPTSGMIFKREWFRVVEAAPAEGRTVRYWDRAATEVTRGSTDPDWTAGVKIRECNGIYYILDVRHFRGTPDSVQRAMRTCADQDGVECEVWAEEDPGQAGKADIVTLSKLFPDRQFYARRVTTNKVTRALPASAQAEIGNIRLVRGPWNEPFLQELDTFADWDQVDVKPQKLPHDDQVDALTGAYNVLAMGGGPRVA